MRAFAGAFGWLDQSYGLLADRVLAIPSSAFLKISRAVLQLPSFEMRLFAKIERASVDKSEFHLSILSFLIIALFSGAIAALMYPAIWSHSEAFSARTSEIFFVGFCVLCALLLAYLIERQMLIRRLRGDLIRAQAYYSDLQRQVEIDILATLSGLNDFQHRLLMEYKRAVRSGGSLSIMVILLAPIADLPEGTEVSGALCDAVKAITRRMRREDSLYHFSRGAFGTIMPGMNAKEAISTAGRLEEGMTDAAGAVGRFRYEISIFNYPQTAATAAELEQAVRALLPKGLISELTVADSFVDSFDLRT